MTVKRKGDVDTPRVIMHKVADIRGGVSVDVTELGGGILLEGAVLSAPVNGICHVVKVATASGAVAAAGTEVKVAKNHNFKAGDFVCAKIGGAAVKVTEVSESKDYDVLKLASALGAMETGDQLMEAAGEADGKNATASLKYDPFAIVGTAKPVEAGTNLITDAWVIAVTQGHPLPADIAGQLKGVINY